MGATSTITTTATGARPFFDLQPTDLGDAVEVASRAFTDKNWVLFAGVALALLVAGLRFFHVSDFLKLPDKGDKWLAVGLSVLTSVSVGLQTGQSWPTIAATAAGVAVTAIGSWEAAVKPTRDAVLRRTRARKRKVEAPMPTPPGVP